VEMPVDMYVLINYLNLIGGAMVSRFTSGLVETASVV
jgi:hypothetical protein